VQYFSDLKTPKFKANKQKQNENGSSDSSALFLQISSSLFVSLFLHFSFFILYFFSIFNSFVATLIVQNRIITTSCSTYETCNENKKLVLK